jgi:hypothetical protein
MPCSCCRVKNQPGHGASGPSIPTESCTNFKVMQTFTWIECTLLETPRGIHYVLVMVPLALNTYRILHKFQSQALYSKDPYRTIWRAGRCASLTMCQNLKPNKSRFSHASCSTAGQVPPLLFTSWAGSYGCLVNEPCLEVELLLLSC